MKRKIFQIFLIGCVIFIYSASYPQSRFVKLSDSPEKEAVSLKILEQDLNHSRLEIKIYGFNRENLPAGEWRRPQVSIPGMVRDKSPGSDRNLRMYRALHIPDLADVSYELIEIEKTLIEDSETEFVKRFSEKKPENLKKYEQVFKLGKPFIIRDIRAVKFCFDPIFTDESSGKIGIISKVVVDILYDRKDAASVEKRNAANYKICKIAAGKTFEQFYQMLLVNYNQLFSGALKKPGNNLQNEKMLIFTTSEYENELTEYIAWKSEKGINVELDTESAGMGSDVIKQKIREKYDNGGLSHVLLIGDIDDVPSVMIDGAPSDPSYVLLEGDDIYGDALISRISANNVNELKLQIKKILIHEKGLYSSDEWINTVLLAQTEQFNGIQHTETIINALESHPENFKNIIKVMSSDNNRTETVKNVIENGVNMIIYNSHGGSTGFGCVPFNVDNVRTLTGSEGRFAMFHGMGCLTGNFAYGSGDCFAEAIMKAGTYEEPSGAVAVLAFTTTGDPMVAMLAQKKAFTELYFEEDIKTYGDLCYFSNMYAMTQFSPYDAERFYTRVHFFGDCTTPILKTSDTKSSIDLVPPDGFKLFQNYPNPFNGNTVIKFVSGESGNAELQIYDVLGKEVYAKRAGAQAGNICSMDIDASDWAAGVYFYRVKTENLISCTKKMVYIK